MSKETADAYGFVSVGDAPPFGDGIKTVQLRHDNKPVMPVEPAAAPPAPATVPATPAPGNPAPAVKKELPRRVLGCPIPGSNKRERMLYLSSVETFLLNQLNNVRTLILEEQGIPEDV